MMSGVCYELKMKVQICHKNDNMCSSPTFYDTLGFDSGYLKYDDDDTSSNKANGILPAGEYTSEYTLIRFCCRNDASPMHPIFLPTDSSFYLVRYFDNCQKVSLKE